LEISKEFACDGGELDNNSRSAVLGKLLGQPSENKPQKPQIREQKKPKSSETSNDTPSSLFEEVQLNRQNQEEEASEVLQEMRNKYANNELNTDIIEGLL